MFISTGQRLAQLFLVEVNICIDVNAEQLLSKQSEPTTVVITNCCFNSITALFKQ